MSDCKHENRTIDCVCKDCGYDFIVDPMTERIRNQERERIIKVVETLRCSANGIEHDCSDDLGGYGVDDLIALIKGENK